MLTTRSSSLLFLIKSPKLAFSSKTVFPPSRFISKNSNWAFPWKPLTPTPKNSAAVLRVYSTDNKYDIHNPFDTEEDNKTETSTTELAERKPASYWGSLFQVWRAPAPALLTGLAGLVPFAAPPLYLYYIATSFEPFLISTQLAYGAVILSFVGGIRWGFVIPYRYGSTHMVTWRSILRSVVPSVIAWGGLLLPDLSAGLLVVSFGLVYSLYNDLRLFGDFPKWMMGLRCLLTTIAVVTLIASIVLVEENRLSNTFGNKTKNKLLDKQIE